MIKSSSNSELVIVLTTELNESLAKNLAKVILSKRLAACISMKEIYSTYWWENQLEENHEIQLLIKTEKNKLEQLLVVLKELHSYQNPEICYWSVSASDEYLKWVEDVIYLAN